MLNTNNPATREEWLLILAAQLVPPMERMAQIEMPLYRVSCSWPLKGGLSRRARVQGQCWAASASTDNHCEIFISPYEDSPKMVAEILAHELIHAAVGTAAGHGPIFKKAALAIGYTTPMRSTPTTEAFWAWVNPILDGMPDYPHKSLNPHRTKLVGGGETSGPQEEGEEAPNRPIGAPAPQRNRQMKCTCEKCGYIARSSRKWIELYGPPICPQDGHGQMQADY